MKLTKTLIAASAVAVLGVSALAGCSAGGGSGDGDGAGSASLTIAKPDGAISTESNNPFVGDSAASKYGYAKVVFETLALVNQTGDRGTTPWLAESLEWNDDYTQLTVVPRSDVTWSDGEPFTATTSSSPSRPPRSPPSTPPASSSRAPRSTATKSC